MVTAAVPTKQTGCADRQFLPVRVVLFFTLGFFSTLGLFGAFSLAFGFLFFLFFGHGRLLSGSLLSGNGLT
jgi:hypothetical protein